MQTAQELDRRFPHSIFSIGGSEQVDDDMMNGILMSLECKFERQLDEKPTAENKLSDYEKYFTIFETVSNVSGLPILEIKSNRRFFHITEPRNVVIFCTRWVTNYSLNLLGRLVSNGKRFDHCTVINACKCITKAIQTKDEPLYPLLARTILSLRDEGIEINFNKNQPDWFLNMINKDRALP